MQRLNHEQVEAVRTEEKKWLLSHRQEAEKLSQ